MVKVSAWMVCLVLGVPRAEEAPNAVTLGAAFRLGPGASARVAAEELQIGFDGVLNDSRCPKGEQCFREGEAILRVWLRKGEREKTFLELRTSPEEAQSAGAQGYVVRLLRLDPYPVSGRLPASKDYVATLEVVRGSRGTAESP